MSDGDRVELRLGSESEPLTVAWELERLRDVTELAGDEPCWSLGTAPAEAPALLRVLTAALEDGTGFGLAAIRPRGSGGHGDEAVGAFVARRGSDPEAILDARLSTEYDAAKRIRRAGLELWTDDTGPPARGAGEREDAVEVERDGWSGEAVRMAFRLDGVPGVAVYELLRPAAAAAGDRARESSRSSAGEAH